MYPFEVLLPVKIPTSHLVPQMRWGEIQSLIMNL